jgi:hypothetical protein
MRVGLFLFNGGLTMKTFILIWSIIFGASAMYYFFTYGELHPLYNTSTICCIVCAVGAIE